MKTKTILTVLASIVLGLVLVLNSGCKKKKGCTDPTALNYDANAEEDDGSCHYAIDDADGIRGGKLYSKFWASETGWVAPSGINVSDITNYGDFYRCKQCHGWDQKGREGAYIDRQPKTTRPSVGINLLPHIAEHDPQDLFDEIKRGADDGRQVDVSLTQDGTNGLGDGMPEFGKILSDQDIWDIVKFLLEERFNTDNLYDLNTTGTYPTGTKTFTNIGKDGSATAGDAVYTTNCSNSSCHGADGKGQMIIDDGDTLSVGYFGRHKPYELQHKIKFGNLGTAMTGVPTLTEQNAKDLLKALQDATKYPDF